MILVQQPEIVMLLQSLCHINNGSCVETKQKRIAKHNNRY